MESESQCIALRGKERCSILINSSVRFCDYCAPLCIPPYLRYKRMEEKIKRWPENETYETILKYYSRLRKAYDLRVTFR